MRSSLRKDKVKICILTSAHPSFDERIFYRECQGLVEIGYGVHLIIDSSRIACK